MVMSASIIIFAGSAPTIRLKYNTKTVYSAKKQYVEGSISIAQGQRVVLYNKKGKPISLQTMPNNGLSANFKLPTPKLKKGTNVFVVRSEKTGDVPASNAATIVLNLTDRPEYKSPSSSSPSGIIPASGMAERIAATAESLAWPADEKSSWKKPFGNTKSLAKEVGMKGASADCGNYVQIVMRAATGNHKIPNFLGKALSTKGNVSDMDNIAKKYGFSAFNWDGENSSLVRGDILVYKNKGDTSSGAGQHIFVYLGGGKIAEASHTDKYYGHIREKNHPLKKSGKSRKFYYVVRATQ